MKLFQKLKEERSNYLQEQEDIKTRYYDDSKKVFQKIIDDLIDGYEAILTEKVKEGRIGQYEFFTVPEISHPSKDVYSKEYTGYEPIDLFQLLVVNDFKEKSYYLSKEIIIDEALLDFWEVLEEEELKPYFLITHTDKLSKRTIYLGVVLPE